LTAVKLFNVSGGKQPLSGQWKRRLTGIVNPDGRRIDSGVKLRSSDGKWLFAALYFFILFIFLYT